MQEFLKFFNDKNKGQWYLSIYYSRTLDWVIDIGYYNFENKELFIHIQHCDIDLVFAKAQVEFKEWLLDNEGGY